VAVVQTHVEHSRTGAASAHGRGGGPGGVRPRHRALLGLQASAGNAAVAQLLRRSDAGAPDRSTGPSGPTPAPAPVPSVQRCGDGPGSCGCGCGPDGDHAEAPVQRQAAVQRQVGGDVTAMSITPEWTRALSDGELASQQMRLREHIEGLPAADPQRDGATTNLRLLEAESQRRTAAQTLAGLTLGPHTGRPPGLPDGGFALTELPDVPAEVLDRLPPGQLTTISTAALYGAGAGAGAAEGAEVAGTAAGAGVLASGVNMTRWGFPGGAQGQYSVGIVVRPRANPLDWGHTALTLRRGGAPLEVVGFNPDMRTAQGLLDLARHHEGVEAGTRAVGGRFTSDAATFLADEAVHIEYSLTEAEAAQFAMTKPGRAPMLDYVARPGVYRPAPGACAGSNCGLWAIGEIEAQTGGVVGRAADPVGITSMGPDGPRATPAGSQPAIVEMAGDGLADPAALRPLTPEGVPPVVSGMPRVIRVLRVGGKVLLVVGIVAGAYEIVASRPEERARTAVGVGGGFVGGFALGATAGLICGPGAPLCSFVLGLGLGTIGALGGRAVAEEVYDGLDEPPPSPVSPTSTSQTSQTTSTSQSAPDQITQWELMFSPPPPPPELLFLGVSGRSPLVRPAIPLDLAFTPYQ
jgi:hypothetical protein